MTTSPFYFDEANHAPYSSRFDDIYYMPEHGRAESRYVYVEGTEIPERIRNHTEKTFHVFEAGFGTGLNFCETLSEFRRDATAPLLHYTAIEKYPPSAADISRALSLCGIDHEYRAICEAAYKKAAASEADIRLEYPGGVLRLIIADIADIETYISADESFHAVFLDGFAPAKNPDMWSDALFLWLANHSIKNGATYCASFTAAGFVRRGLENAGFSVERLKGFGRKRHMIKAVF